MRGVRPLRLPAHHGTSALLAGAYPFLATAPWDVGPPVGIDTLTGEPFCFDPWALHDTNRLTNPNVLLAGVIGQGKSALAKSLALRAVAAGRRVYVPGDPKGEWADVAEAVGGTVVRVGPSHSTRLNPLDITDEAAHDAQVVGTETAQPRARPVRLRLVGAICETLLARPLLPAEHAALDAAVAAIEQPTGAGGTRAPTIRDVIAALRNPDTKDARRNGVTTAQRVTDGRDLAHVLARLTSGDLGGVLDGPTTMDLEQDAPMVVFDLSGLGADDTAVALAMMCISAWLQAALAGRTEFRPRWIIYDEAWRLLRSPVLVRRMQSQWKLSRAHGIANLLIIHRLSDLAAVGNLGDESRALAEGLLADCSTRIIYRQEPDQIPDLAEAIGLTATEVTLLAGLPRGVGLWKCSGSTSLIRHHLHPEEAVMAFTDGAMQKGGGSRTPGSRGVGGRL